MSFTDEQRAKAADTRRRNAEARRSEKLMSTGMGESKIFRDPNAPDPYAHIREAHIKGVRIGDSFTEQQIALLSWDMTDEGIAERNAGKSEHRISTVRDEFTGSCMERKDRIQAGQEPWQAPDAFRETRDQYAEPGKTYRYLSEATISQRGMRGWEPVKDENGSQVKVRNLILAEMPKDVAHQRNEFYRSKGNDAMKQAAERFKEGNKDRTAVGDIQQA